MTEERCKYTYLRCVLLKLGDSTCSTYKKTDAHEGVRKLHFTGNPVSEWSEICRLGRVFPKLESLVLAECPLRAIIAPPKSPTANERSANSCDEDSSPHQHFR